MAELNNKMGAVIGKLHPRTLEILTTKLPLGQRKIVVSDILDAAEKVYFPYQKIILERNRKEQIMKMKEKRQLTRKEVIKMLGILPTNYTEVLEAELNLLMIIIEKHPNVDLGKFTEHFDTIYRDWDNKDTTKFFKAKKFMMKNGVWQLVQECLDELADCGCLY